LLRLLSAPSGSPIRRGFFIGSAYSGVSATSWGPVGAARDTSLFWRVAFLVAGHVPKVTEANNDASDQDKPSESGKKIRLRGGGSSPRRLGLLLGYSKGHNLEKASDQARA
jgi:hypothetical protein